MKHRLGKKHRWAVEQRRGRGSLRDGGRLGHQRGRCRELSRVHASLRAASISRTASSSSPRYFGGRGEHGRRRYWRTPLMYASRDRVMRVLGVQSEMELAYAGLQQLCAGLLEAARADRVLPEPGFS
jgi:hypothetical protein